MATELMARDLTGELDMELVGAFLFNGSILLDPVGADHGLKSLPGFAS